MPRVPVPAESSRRGVDEDGAVPVAIVEPSEAPKPKSGRGGSDRFRLLVGRSGENVPTQMGEIPLLTRKEEIRLAKTIEDTRRQFRHRLLECDYVIRKCL